MIVITKKYRTGPKEYIVYENYDEFQSVNKPIIPLNKAIQGDYVLSDNGYYLLLIKKEIIKKGKYGDFVKFTFPGYVYNTMQYYDSGNLRAKPLVWSRENVTKPRYFVTARQRLFAMYLAQGMDIYQAFGMVFSNKNRTSREQYIKSILTNPNFSNYMLKSGLMETAKKAFEKNGIDNNFLAMELKRIVLNNNEAYQLKIQALKMIDTVLNGSEKAIMNEPDETMNDLRDKFNISEIKTA